MTPLLVLHVTKNTLANPSRVKVVRKENFEKILIIDNFSSCYLMVMKICTVIELENV